MAREMSVSDRLLRRATLIDTVTTSEIFITGNYSMRPCFCDVCMYSHCVLLQVQG